MPAHDKRPGGDWEAGMTAPSPLQSLTNHMLGVMSPEECLCRRSNLVAALTNPLQEILWPSNYPIPQEEELFLRMLVSWDVCSKSCNIDLLQLFSVMGLTSTSPGQNIRVSSSVNMRSVQADLPGLPVISVSP